MVGACVTREQVATRVEVLMAVLDNRRNRGLISDWEWSQAARLVSMRTVVWLRDATDGTISDRVS